MNVESSRPPITARASGFWSSAPEPRPKRERQQAEERCQRGHKIGRMRIFPAATSASSSGIFSSSQSL